MSESEGEEQSCSYLLKVLLSFLDLIWHKYTMYWSGLSTGYGINMIDTEMTRDKAIKTAYIRMILVIIL